MMAMRESQHRDTIRATLVLAATALLVACGDAATGGSGLVPDTTVEVGNDAVGDVDPVDADVADEPDAALPDADASVDAADAADGSGEPDVPDTDDATDVPSELCGPDHCEIDGECYENGTANPENPCEACVAVLATNQWSADDSATCDDGDVCTQTDVCRDGACVGAVLLCDDGDPCTADLCDAESGGCAFVNAEGPCEDSDLCSTGDVCVEGLCVGGTGVLACDDGNPCTAESCDPELGCVSEPLDGATCDDGDPCTVGDVCAAGLCAAGGERLACDDGNLCTIDRCVPGLGCDAVSVADRCVDDNPCTDEACDPLQGCVYPFNTDPCDDGSFCTDADTCQEGACRGTPVPVDDFNQCTIDSCDPAVGVVYSDREGECDDFDACTVGDECLDGECQIGATPLDCSDTNVCTDEYCDSDIGCVVEFNTLGCDDFDACTVGDTCGEGECLGAPRDCDDGNACTIDSCDSATGCVNELIVSNDCRPEILVTFPERAATIVDATGAPVVVRGRVRSGAGDITAFTLNGSPVTLSPDPENEGWQRFAVPVPARQGTTVLDFRATDELGSTRERVQSYHWARSYAPRTPGWVDPGLALWLGQASIDDGVAPPPQDLAAIFNRVIATLDVGSLIDPNQVLASQAGYNIYISSITFGSSSVALQAIDGGLSIEASINTVAARLSFDCTEVRCRFLGGDGDGWARISSLTVSADLLIAVRPDRSLQVTVANADSEIDGLNISADNVWTNLLLGIVEVFIRNSLVSSFESELTGLLGVEIGPLLEEALEGLAINLPFDLPRLDNPDATVPVTLNSDFSVVDFQDAEPGPQGGAIVLRARATTPTRATPAGNPYDANLGVPLRERCTGAAQTNGLRRTDPFELALADDAINAILHAAWWGGFLQFEVGPELLGDIDLAEFGVSDLEMTISGLLPPLASDCGRGALTLALSDHRINVSLRFSGIPVRLVVHAALFAPIRITAEGGELGIVVDEIGEIAIEVEADDPASVPFEDAIAGLLEEQLVPALGGLLGGGEPLAAFPLPEIDLSESVGAPAGTVVIAIQPTSVNRNDGNTVIGGRLE